MDGHKHLFDLMLQIAAAENGEITLDIPEENFNLGMLKVLREKARRENKAVRFNPTGPRSHRLVDSLQEERLPESKKEKEAKEAAPAPRWGWRRFGIVFSAVIGLLLLLGAGAFAAIYYLPKAEVILKLSPIPLVKEISATADTAAQKVDGALGVVPGTLQTVEETGTKSTPPTGTATIGVKAKGAVTFVNCTDTPATFAEGAQIKAEGTSLTYTLDTAVSEVPAISGATCGTKVGNVTATKIGSDHNKGEGTEFDFISYANEPAYNVILASGQSLSGGSSEDVTVAAATDHTKLLDELQAELVEKAKATIQSRSGIDEVVVDAAIKTEVLEKTYSHAVGEQAENVSLTMKVKLTTITYTGTNIQELVAQALSTLVPAGFTLFPGETEIEALDPQLQETKLSFRAKISALVIPEIDEEKIKEALAGRNPQSAQDYLGSLGDIESFELKIWPNLPGSLQRVPRNTGRITVRLETE
uniref:Baseplate protein J-like domain-containing protein n=1 Tax=candidate division WWE3 bacterium TaxID=2053526 RepID=A0A832E224_UNCKA